MKNNVLNIMKKEFARFFGDRRMLIMLILPAVMIYVVYSFMGSAMQDMYVPDEEYTPVIYAVNMPSSLSEEGICGITRPVGTDTIPDLVAAKEKIVLKEADLCLVFPADFDEQVADYQVQAATSAAPNVELYFNSSDVNSQMTFQDVMAQLDAYESSLANKFDVNRDISQTDLATEEDATAQLISSLMPMLLMIFLYSGCVGLAPESIAGEKERGTIGALLVSPLKRSELAIGKILSLGTLAFFSGLISAAATVLSLPKLMGIDGGLNVDIYAISDYICLAAVILSTILLLITLISIISAFAKTVKEAAAAVVPLMIVVMLVGVTGMFGGSAQASQASWFIPLYNSVQSMSGVFSLNYSVTSVVITALSNLVYAFLGGFVLTKMFNSEKIMFSK